MGIDVGWHRGPGSPPLAVGIIVGIDVGWHRGPGSPPIAVGIDVGLDVGLAVGIDVGIAVGGESTHRSRAAITTAEDVG